MYSFKTACTEFSGDEGEVPELLDEPAAVVNESLSLKLSLT
jgi:hypothetical protein